MYMQYMYINIYVNIHLYICIYTYIYIYIYAYIHTFIYVYTHFFCICTYIFKQIDQHYIHTHLQIHKFMYITCLGILLSSRPSTITARHCVIASLSVDLKVLRSTRASLLLSLPNKFAFPTPNSESGVSDVMRARTRSHKSNMPVSATHP